MAVKEHSFGPLYLAVVRTNVRYCPLHRVRIVEMSDPFRTGRAVLVPTIKPFTAVSFGTWRRHKKDVEDQFETDQWFNPKLLDQQGKDIKWWSGAETDKTAV